MNRRTLIRGAVGLAAAGALLWLPRRRRRSAGEAREVRFVRQLGLGYLPLYVMQAHGLVEKHARALGHPGLTASYRAVATPTSMNDLLLTDGTDFVAAGFPPFLTAWDKTRGTLDVRALAALSCQPFLLVTNNPRVRTIADFDAGDRIAVPAVKVSSQSTFLQMLAEKRFGAGNHDKLEPLTVGLSHPEAMAALVSGRSEITAHFASMPFQTAELREPTIHRVASSYDATDGPSTATAIWTTSRFFGENPLTVRAVLAALDEATRFILAQPKEAAAIYRDVDDRSRPLELLEACVRDPEVVWTLAPHRVLGLTSFLARTGRLARAPSDERELFFPRPHLAASS